MLQKINIIFYIHNYYKQKGRISNEIRPSHFYINQKSYFR